MRLALLLLVISCGDNLEQPPCDRNDPTCFQAEAPQDWTSLRCPTLLYGVRLCEELPSSDCQRPLDENDGTGLECPDTGFSFAPCWCHTAVVDSEGWCMPDWSGQ